MRRLPDILIALLGALFLAAGATKLAAMPMQVTNFARWGFPAWFLYAVGALELLAAVMIFLPSKRPYGAALIVMMMLGAAGTLLREGRVTGTLVPLSVLLLAVFVWSRAKGAAGPAS